MLSNIVVKYTLHCSALYHNKLSTAVHSIMMKSFLVQKEVYGKPKGRKYKVEVTPDGIVHDIVEKSVTLLRYNDNRQ